MEIKSISLWMRYKNNNMTIAKKKMQNQMTEIKIKNNVK